LFDAYANQLKPPSKTPTLTNWNLKKEKPWISSLATCLLSDNIVVTSLEAKMQVNIRSLGNSKGILIPKPILEQTGLQDVAELRVNNGVIEIRPVKTNPREGWAMDSQRIAMDKDHSLVWPEFGNADDKDLKW